MSEKTRTREHLTPDYATVLADLNRQPERAASNLQSAFAILTERAAETLNVSRANIWLFTDSTRSKMRCFDEFDLTNQEHSAGAILDGASFPVYIEALKSERVIVADDAARDPRTYEFGKEYLPANNIKSMLDASIRQDGQVVGVICLEQMDYLRQWTEDEASFVGTLSDFATIALISHHKDIAERSLIQAQKMESLGRLAGGIAHDFNNILMVITGAVDTLQLNPDVPAEDDRLLTLISEASGRASKLTRNLLAFGGKQELRLSAVSTSELIKAVQSLTKGLIREDIAVDFDSGSEERWVLADPTQLEQVLLNLLINSTDAMPNGGDLKVEVLSVDQHDHVGFAVTDTGKGMTEAVIQRIFEPFFTTKGDHGTGLGLSTSLGIVQQHDGVLSCTKSDASGTRFEMRIPQASKASQPAEADHLESASRHPDSKHRVLLVEDEVGVRDIVTQMLGAIGYDTLVAENAAHALALLEEQDVDLLISDVVMPDMRGPEIYRHALKLRPGLSALFVSGYSEEVISEVPTGDNRVGYLSKPFTLRELRAAVDGLITGKEALS